MLAFGNAQVQFPGRYPCSEGVEVSSHSQSLLRVKDEFHIIGKDQALADKVVRKAVHVYYE